MARPVLLVLFVHLVLLVLLVGLLITSRLIPDFRSVLLVSVLCSVLSSLVSRGRIVF